ncbi:class I SAM-dependent methyltransferase [Candidatus Aerophobetes bacterium]|uniref:Class I SAM-dependent methyltransferase n=1 Tax=Aerophobetes bacterium TaxID=2030807 RepID=A0A523QLK8_UNCAE|nr:MAG: class I SAM-dependent methyltransferase [Candidatus Aerophobetes bacterium]
MSHRHGVILTRLKKGIPAVKICKEPLYKKDEAKYLKEREAFSERDNQEKFSLLLDKIERCQRLVDIGCGWGQFLSLVEDNVSELWGVDESPDRLKYLRSVCPKAKVVICQAHQLKLPDKYFDVAITSQMLHEVKLFGEKSGLQKVLEEIRRVLIKGGKYLLLDHQDAGEEEIVVKLPIQKMKQLSEFEGKYQYYRATHQSIGENMVKISKRCLQDFLTKYWALNSPMESIEMRETHSVFEKTETIELVESLGFQVREWIPFSDIGNDLKRAEGELLEGKTWFRKFLLVAATPK